MYHTDFRIDAKGVTPIPAPTSITTSYWKTSSLAVPNGPSTAILETEQREIHILLAMSYYNKFTKTNEEEVDLWK